MSIVLLLSSIFHAQAVPLQLSQQGRILDSTGAAVTGLHNVTCRIYDAQNNGSLLWSEIIATNFTNGYYAVVMGSDELNNPLDTDTLSLYPLYIEIELDNNGPMTPRSAINSAPYAQIAGVAESVNGGTVNASQVQIGGNTVIDGGGNWVGPATTVNWNDIDPSSIPSYIVDGDDNTQLSESQVEGYITNGAITLASNSQIGTDGAILGANSTLDWNNISSVTIPAGLSDGDDDLLSNIICTPGEILGFDGVGWSCVSDNTLTVSDIAAILSANAMNLAAGSQIGTDGTILGSSSILDWNNLINVPIGLADGDTDTQLSETQVEGYITNGAITLASNSQIGTDGAILGANSTLDWNNLTNVPTGLTDGDNDTLGAMSCSNGQSVVYDAANSVWTCALLSDTLAGLECTVGQSITYNGANWACTDFSSLIDQDGDGILSWNDCDDNDQNSNNVSDDADCDTILTADDCDDNDPSLLYPDGSISACPAESCKEILDNGFSTGSGSYYINPTGVPAFQVTCDMSTSGGGWTVIPETTSYGYQIYTEGVGEQPYSYSLTNAQITAIHDVSTEGRQDFQCQTVGVGTEYDLRGWNNNLFGVSAGCWATNNSDYKSSSGTYTTFAQIPVKSWLSEDCGDPSESCQHNVSNAYLR